MKRLIGLTQRVEVTPHGERRDALDQAWAPLIQSLGFQPVPLPNLRLNIEAYLDDLNLSGIILTGGNDLSSLPHPETPAPERDEAEAAILSYACQHRLPVLGVCRGMQVINHYFGGSLTPVSGHVRTRHRIIPKEDALWEQVFEVNSFHHYGILPETLADTLAIWGVCDDGSIEAVRQSEGRIYGVMWHPEREAALAPHDRMLFDAVFGADECRP
jgi:putative glutamine amidotransferase